MKWYTAIGIKTEDDEGRLLVKIGGQEKVLTEIETMLWAALTWSVCAENRIYSQMYRVLCITFGEEKATDWADEEDFLFCLRRLKKRGLVAECDGASKEEALWFLLSKSVVSPARNSLFERLGTFADDLALGKGLKIALRAFKSPVLTYEERMVLQQIAGNGYVPYHLAELTRQAGAVPLSVEERKKVQNQALQKFMQILVSLFKKKQFVISCIKEGGFLEKKKKWKTWLSEQFRKCRENYARIPDFFKKRIVNTLLLSFLLLYGGCALGLTQKSAGFVGWTVYLTVCGIGYALYIYYLAVTKSYEVVEGTVTEIHAELLFDGFKRVLVQGDDGLTTELLLNKETTVMHGKTYRFYFNQSDHARSGIHRLDAAFDFGNFFGVEEVKE